MTSQPTGDPWCVVCGAQLCRCHEQVRKHDLFKTLTPEEFEKAPVLSEQKIREALDRARETMRKLSNRHPPLPRYRKCP